MTLRRRFLVRPWSRDAALATLTLLLAYASTMASDGVVVTRDGLRFPLERVQNELALTFRSLDKVGPCARRLADTGRGLVENVPGAPRARIKLLRLSDPSATPRGLLSEPEIAEVHAVYRYQGSQVRLVSSGTVNVRLQKGLSRPQQGRVWADYDVEVLEQLAGLDNVFIVKPTGNDTIDVEVAAILADDPRTVWAQPNFRTPVHARQVTPGDTYFAEQWHLNNTGQTGGTIDADIDAPEAWTLADGGDIVIGMFDDACDVHHEDLRGNYIGVGHDPAATGDVADAEDPRPKQLGDFHGTAVMGLAVARANNKGVVGVSFGSQFTVSRGLGEFLTDAEIASVYTFALQQDVDVHINSWGLDFDAFIPSIIEDGIETAFLEGRDLDGPDGPERPRGMVILFASGNGRSLLDTDAARVTAGRELATLPTVIGIGASNHRDEVASYSNFGPEIDLLAPGGGDFAGIATVDVDDEAGYVELGLNVGGAEAATGLADIDPDGLYTGTFAGTSAACPIAAGAASLTLSMNPLLSATDVRLILEHTADRISPEDASYDVVTHRSLRYGYGRINAHSAVVAAQQSLNNGGRTWPERVADVLVLSSTISWLQNGDPLEYPIEDEDEEEPTTVRSPTTDEFLVLESDSPIDFMPQDGACYDGNQLGCATVTPTQLPENVRILATGCGLLCRDRGLGACEIGADQCVEYIQPAGIKYFAIYARSSIGRYSFGVTVDSSGTIKDDGQLPPGGSALTGGGGGGGGGDTERPVDPPQVTATASPLEGFSPLTVRFTGNGVRGDFDIDDSRTSWDFDISDGITPDSSVRSVQHTYVAETGGVFTARLTMYDVATPANVGFVDVRITVVGSGADSGTGTTAAGSFQIEVRQPGGTEEITQGISPFGVELSLRASGVEGQVTSVHWDLGDGTTSDGQQVSHTYVNNETCGDGQLCDSKTGACVAEAECEFSAECVGNSACNHLSFPVTAELTISTNQGTQLKAAGTIITVQPGPTVRVIPDIILEGTQPVQGTGGGDGGLCGFLGMLPLSILLMSLFWMRLRR